MKRYRDYMDEVQPPEELHDRLLGLNAPKKTIHWQRYGTLAAALALVIGLGAAGLSRIGANPPGLEPAEIGELEPDVGAPDIAPEGPGGDAIDETNQTDGGYELTSEDGLMRSYLILPAIIYNEQGEAVSMDYSLAPPSALRREAALDDVIALVGSQEAMKLHLLWGGELDWSGTVWFLEDGTPCAAGLCAKGDGVSLYIEMMVGSEVPSCIVFPDDCYETTTFNGVEIKALKTPACTIADGIEISESRELSCFADGVGYKLTIYGADSQRMEAMCARFARWAIVEGFDLAALSADGAAPWIASDPGDPVGEPNYED